LKKPHKFCIFN